jgi:hypothetical protein
MRTAFKITIESMPIVLTLALLAACAANLALVCVWL